MSPSKSLLAQARGGLDAGVAGADDDDRGTKTSLGSLDREAVAAGVIRRRRGGTPGARGSWLARPGIVRRHRRRIDDDPDPASAERVTPERRASARQLAPRRCCDRSRGDGAGSPARSGAGSGSIGGGSTRRRDALVRRAPDEGVEPPRGRDGRPPVADDAVGHPGLVAGRARGARRATRAPRPDGPPPPRCRPSAGKRGGSVARAANRRRAAARWPRGRRRGHAPRAPRGRPSASIRDRSARVRASVRARASRSSAESPCRTRR